MSRVEHLLMGRDKPDERSESRVTPFPGEPSMWFFIIGDLLIFGTYFVFYMAYRSQNSELFLQSQGQLSVEIAVINTVILLTSSLFVALGLEAAREGKRQQGIRLFGLAFLMGSLFPIVKIIEWIPKISAGLTPGENLFFMYYYVLTGMHLVHVFLGLAILGFVIHNLRTSNKPNIKFLETGAIYWHMVDLLWLVLLALLYLMR